MKRLWIQNLCITAVFLAVFFLVVAVGLDEGKRSRSVQAAGIVLPDRETERKEKIPQTDSLPRNENDVVYITKSGTKYHLWADCSALKQAKAIIATRLKDAENDGKELCSFCNERQNP